MSNLLLIQVLRDALAREEAKIERARVEIFKLECELADLGVELPLPQPPLSDGAGVRQS